MGKLRPKEVADEARASRAPSLHFHVRELVMFLKVILFF